MNEEQRVWMNGIYPYLRMLVRINENFLKLSNRLTEKNTEDIFFDMSTDLLRLLPYKIKDEKVCILILLNDGIIKLKKYFDFLKEDYKKILEKHSNILIDIIKIRNKYIHEPHNINWTGYLYSENNCYMEFLYENEIYQMNTEDLKKIIFQLNSIFIEIQEKFRTEINNLSNDMQDHPYIESIISINLIDYKNKISGGKFNV